MQQTDLASAGEMDQVVSFLAVVESVDVSGGAVSTSSPFAGQGSRVLWAQVTRSQGSEISEADKPTAMARAKVEMKFLAGITKSMSLAWQGIEWQISDLDAQPRIDRLFVYIERRGSSGDGNPR